MALFVTVDELRDCLGVGTLYPDATLESVCQVATETLQQYLWYNSYPVIGGTIQDNVATVIISAPVSFTAGQTAAISSSGSGLNGNHTITATWPWSQGSGTFPMFSYYFPYGYYNFPKNYSLIQFATVNKANMNYRLIQPYGKILATDGSDTQDPAYEDIDSIRQAALMLAVDCWQARQAPSSGGVSVDGFTPSPYRLGAAMLAKVRQIIAPYTSPRSMIG